MSVDYRFVKISIINKLLKVIPAPIKTTLKTLRFDKLLHIMYNKYDAELSFQKEWVKEFKDNKTKVLEYWKKYRYLDDIIKICNISENAKILDVGCGISTVLHYIPGKEKIGIDPLADEYLKLYKYPNDIKIVKGFGEDIPFSNEYFDVVFCSNVLDHVTDPNKTINEIYRILKVGGYFVLTVEIFQKRVKRNHAHPYSFTKNDIYTLFKDKKFKKIFEKESPFIGLRAYVNGLKEYRNKELIMILKKF